MKKGKNIPIIENSLSNVPEAGENSGEFQEGQSGGSAKSKKDQQGRRVRLGLSWTLYSRQEHLSQQSTVGTACPRARAVCVCLFVCIVLIL